jgi:hypothetical protein
LTVFEQAMALFPLIERANPRFYELSNAGFARTGADLSHWFAAILVGKRSERGSGARIQCRLACHTEGI